MTILEELYEAYCEGKLSVKPPEPEVHEGFILTSIEEKFELTDEQVGFFENEYFKLRINTENQFFAADVKVALRMISE